MIKTNGADPNLAEPREPRGPGDIGEKWGVSSTSLPIRRGTRPVYTSSLLIAAIMTGVSLGGLLYPSNLYPTDQLLEAFLANDVINLLIGLPILVGSIWLARRGRMVGLLLWPGALLYILYNYTVYLTGTPLSIYTIPYLSLVILCVYGIQDLVRNIDAESVQQQISENVPRRTGGWVLVAFGTLFAIRATGIIIEAETSQTTLPISEIGLLIGDIALSIPIIAGGIMLLGKKPLGYTSGPGLLFATSMLYVGLILTLIVQPILTDTSPNPVDIIVVLVMGLIFFIPTGLYIRGTTKNRDITHPGA